MRLVLALSILAALPSCTSSPEAAPPKEASPAKVAPKITQFYANPPVVPKGQAALLCYGVEDAAKVSVEPAVQPLSPALTRCFEVKPERTTSYTLSAASADGATVTQTATVTIGAAAPRLFDLSITKNSVRPGEQIAFCFQAANATKVSGSPGHFMKGGNPAKDCLGDAPRQRTTYKIVVSNADGLTDSASMTVEVKP